MPKCSGNLIESMGIKFLGYNFIQSSTTHLKIWWRMENEEWRMENGEWRLEIGDWRMKNKRFNDTISFKLQFSRGYKACHTC